VSSDAFGRGITRRDLIKVGAQTTALVATGSALAACGSSGSAGKSSTSGAPAFSPGPPTTGTPVRGGTLTVAMLSDGAAETIDVRKITNYPIFRGARLCSITYLPRLRAASSRHSRSQPSATATQRFGLSSSGTV